MHVSAVATAPATLRLPDLYLAGTLMFSQPSRQIEPMGRGSDADASHEA